MNKLKIVAKGNAEVDVLIYGDIGPSWDGESVEAAKFVRDLMNIDPKSAINARINSYGGSVSEGIAIYNALGRHPGPVNVHVDGVAISIASLIAMSGKKVIMAENAVMMIHGPMAMAAGNAQDMRETADILDKYAQAMAPSYAAKTGKPSSEMLALLTDGKDHWYTATEAQAAGFADEVSSPVQVTAHFDLGRYKSYPAAAAAFHRSSTMTPEELAAKAAQDAAKEKADKEAKAKADADVKAAADKAAAEAAARGLTLVPSNGRTKDDNAAIKAAYAPFMQTEGVTALYQSVLEDPEITVPVARDKLLVALGKDTKPGTPDAHHVQMGESDRDKFRTACVVALMARSGRATDKERETLGQNPYRGLTLVEMCRASLDRIHVNHRGMDPMTVAATAITQSTSDFPILLEEVINKTLRGAYAIQADTWRRFCAIGSVNDFKVNRRYRLGSFSNLDTVNENGEYKNKPIPDGEKSTIQVETKGNIINLSRKMIINDDIGAFTGLAAGLGRAAKRSVEQDVYDLLGQNSGAGPTMADTGILFNAIALTTPGGHANRAAYAVPTVALLDAARVAMMRQMDVGGNDFLDLRPQIALVPPQLASTFKILNGAVYDPTAVANKAQMTPNAVAGIVSDIVDSARITWNGWYLFADPSVAPVIEVDFLNGNQEPFTEMQEGFRVDGVEWKVRLDYGVSVVDFRGGYASVGS